MNKLINEEKNLPCNKNATYNFRKENGIRKVLLSKHHNSY